MKIVLGGPGCGKTRRLMEEMMNELNSGVHPSEIAFVAFTRKAAHEARDRAMKKFGLSEDDLPYFRTLHSFAFRQLKLSPTEVMSEKDYKSLGDAMGLCFGKPDDDTGVPLSDEPGAQRLYLEHLARLTMRPLRDVCADYRTQDYFLVKVLADALVNYKASRKIVDFTDMISLFVKNAECPRLKVVFVDEAQDLSPLQWLMVERITYGSDRVYIAGDDDQAIYEWSGADVKTFLNLHGDRIVLPKSERLPRVVFNFSQEILKRIKNRYEKKWDPASEGGNIFRWNDPESIDVSEGSWYMLARNRYMLSGYISTLRDRGYPYISMGHNSIDNPSVRALIAWEHLRKGDSLPGRTARSLFTKLRDGGVRKSAAGGKSIAENALLTYDDLRAHGLLLPRDEDWMSAIRMAQSEREYYRAIRRRGESLTETPRITVSTIHQVKGGEADHVAIVRDMSYKCIQSLMRTPDTEHRVFYVAATRAKKSLHILHPRTGKHYEL